MFSTAKKGRSYVVNDWRIVDLAASTPGQLPPSPEHLRFVPALPLILPSGCFSLSVFDTPKKHNGQGMTYDNKLRLHTG